MKVYRYMRGSHIENVTEEKVRAEKARAHEKYHANADKVLALEIGQSVTFDSGATYKRLPDDTGAFMAIVCTRGSRKRCNFKRSAREKMCGADAHVLCDFRTAPGKTCDAPPFPRHSVPVGKNVDYCIEHQQPATAKGARP